MWEAILEHYGQDPGRANRGTRAGQAAAARVANVPISTLGSRIQRGLPPDAEWCLRWHADAGDALPLETMRPDLPWPRSAAA